MTTPFVFALMVTVTPTPAPFHGDAYAICGPQPDPRCLELADQCLRTEAAKGTDADLAFEWCANEVEGLDPYLVHFRGRT